MHFTLFDLAGWAIFAWILMIFLPSWRITRWLAASAVFPIYICVLYAIGISVALSQTGFGVMRDFGSAEGVLRILQLPNVALIAWIHILAFDQFVGLWIYRDNMRDRYVPLPIQSVLLFVTLMLGPLGLLAYWAIRGARRAPRPTPGGGTRLIAWSDPFPDAPTGPAQERTGQATIATAFAAMAGDRLDDRIATLPSPVASPWRYIAAVWTREERGLTLMGLLGIVLAAAVGVIAVVHGPVIEPEGVLAKPISFDLAVGIYTLTLALYVPLARFPRKTLARWRTAALILTPIGLAIETVQSLRGLDPRFSNVASTADDIIGGIFFMFALGMITLFWILAIRFFDLRRPQAEGQLALSIRYAFGATMLAFAAGMVMSVVVSGRFIGQSGNLLTLHALGFHGLQAVPIVAILLARSSFDANGARRWIHAAGITWVGTCALVGAQTMAGLSIFVPTGASIGAALFFAGWLAITSYAFLAATRHRPERQIA